MVDLLNDDTLDDDTTRREELIERIYSESLDEICVDFGLDVDADDCDDIEEFFDFAESAPEEDLATAYYLCSAEMKSYIDAIRAITSKFNRSSVYAVDDPRDLYQWIEDEIPGHLEPYFDWDFFLSDMQKSGELQEFYFQGKPWYVVGG